ncbi:uncharacterized protein K452DRAFT_113007 [Aplosporella prunicola CBS 121167]|uniref:Uncharacterized protein n=1 Tax=Aplosporella prunicola CBS 121167 TaxID=1176127 RepID=A0A6A6AZC9_9PEZI|nr:uncharacterized protein K452DRAFT_113007 [Aplosporella prunicola CBS 121167]KAF2137140.1 hypothetical protein K452DRAFT_113007 [Aplosporella prunicola CBS 121167]
MGICLTQERCIQSLPGIRRGRLHKRQIDAGGTARTVASRPCARTDAIFRRTRLRPRRPSLYQDVDAASFTVSALALAALTSRRSLWTVSSFATHLTQPSLLRQRRVPG